MKKIMKRLSIALMMLVLVMGLTACSKAEEVEEAPVEEAAPEAEEAPAEEAPQAEEADFEA